MNKSDVAYLVSQSHTANVYGVYEATETKRKVYVNVSSIGQKEWFEGGRNGLNPQYRFTMFQFDYLGEQIIEYKDVQYTIYRTFVKDHDEIELYAELKKGYGKKDQAAGSD